MAGSFMMKRSFLYVDEGDDLAADLVNACLTPDGAAEAVPRPESAKEEL
jgi:hypothetical protein